MLKNVIIKEQEQVNIFLYNLDIKRNTKVAVKSVLVKK